MANILNVAIVEDDFSLSTLLKTKINSIQGYHCDHTFTIIEDILKNNNEFNIILLDINLPTMSGLEAIPLLIKKFPFASIVMNTIMDDATTIFSALKSGAVGYIDKQSFDDNIEEVLESVSNGGAYMTPKIARKVIENFKTPKVTNLSDRELDVVNGILEGMSYKLIADQNNISIDTVRSHIKNIYKKLSINSKAQLFNLFKR
jgi:DNA-binding NarL/FixJ family response regulator